jgi:hypothetical protein
LNVSFKVTNGSLHVWSRREAEGGKKIVIVRIGKGYFPVMIIVKLLHLLSCLSMTRGGRFGEMI